MLAVGGKSNSLGRTGEVVELVLDDRQRLDQLYDCLFAEDVWLRMRAADALEKVCRRHPDWLRPYVDRLLKDFATSAQPSIQWHMAQILGEVELTDAQKRSAISWFEQLLSTEGVDWIVAANAMDTLVQFCRNGLPPVADVVPLLRIQQGHNSRAVVKRADRYLAELSPN